MRPTRSARTRSTSTWPGCGPSWPAPERTDIDADGAPVFLWEVNAQGSVTAHSPGAPRPPAAPPLRDGLVTTANLGRVGEFTLKTIRHGTGWLIAGQSLAGDAHTE